MEIQKGILSMNKNVQHKDADSGKLLKYCIIPQPVTSSDAMLSFEKSDDVILAVMNEEYVLNLSYEDVSQLICALFNLREDC